MIIGSVGLRRLTKLWSGAAELVGREINPHILSQEEFCERKKSRDHFIASVLSSPMIFVKGNERMTIQAGRPKRMPTS